MFSNQEQNGVGYVRREKKIDPHPLGFSRGILFMEVFADAYCPSGGSTWSISPKKYIKACTEEGEFRC